MSLFQTVVDVWLGTTCYAYGRRAGVLSRPNLQRVPRDDVRSILKLYFDFGESSLDRIEAAELVVQRTLDGFRSGKGGPLDGVLTQRALVKEANKLPKWKTWKSFPPFPRFPLKDTRAVLQPVLSRFIADASRLLRALRKRF